MDYNNMTLFQEGALEIDNPQSREEDEAVEEQKRRQEELTDLLAAGIHAFNYDESTMNSSATSFDEQHYYDQQQSRKELNFDNEKTTDVSGVLQQNYKDASQQDQLKVLYEVRGREIKKLINEFNQYKEEKLKEINILKNKVTLSEAEIRHLQISLSNAESLLVEKTEMVKDLQESLKSRDNEIENLKKLNDEFKMEICTYNSTVNELQLKLSDNHPFKKEARKFKSDELQKAHQNQVAKLESLLQEQSKKAQIFEKEKLHLEDEVKRLITEKNETKEENNLTIIALSKKLQSSQQQCRDLYLLGEAIKKESDHFKERIQQLENNLNVYDHSDPCVEILEKETLTRHLEKLKRMLLDKDVEMSTLRAKLKFYNSDMDELFEYRRLLNQIHSYEVKPCNNTEHEELLIFMQRQLQSYQQAVDDRNNQIITLNMVNKELQEKIEEMIQQTRTDIQNLSQKYSLPQLETMSNELKNAEKTINDLQQQLLEKEEICKSLQQQLDVIHKDYQDFQQTTHEEKLNFDKMKNDLKRVEEEKTNLKELNEEIQKSQLKLINENTEIKTQLQKMSFKLNSLETVFIESDSDVQKINSLKAKYGEITSTLEKLSPQRKEHCDINVILQLRKRILKCINLLQNQGFEKAEIEETLKHWDNMLREFIENVKHNNLFSLHMEDKQRKDIIQELTNNNTLLEGEKCSLECQLQSCKSELEDAKKEIEVLMEDKKNLIKEAENSLHKIQNLHDQLNSLKECMKIVEENKMEIEKQLEYTQKKLNEAKQESINLHKEVSEVNENIVRKNLFKELKDVENMLEQDREENDISGSEIFKKCVQAEILKAELVLRERFEEENIRKMQKIEDQYKNVLTQKSDIYNKEKEKWRTQEAKYRKQFAVVLEECGRKIDELETENMNLMKQTNQLLNEYKTFRTNALEDIGKFKTLIINYQQKIEHLNKQWVDLFEFYVHNFTNIQKQNNKKIKRIQKSMSMSETEINLIESIYNEKITKLQSEWKCSSKAQLCKNDFI